MLIGTLSADGAHLHASVADDAGRGEGRAPDAGLHRAHHGRSGDRAAAGMGVPARAGRRPPATRNWRRGSEPLGAAACTPGYGSSAVTTVAVIDFETTGLSPAMGDRATEIAIVLLEGDRVVDRFQSLMNAGVRISAFIEAYTGISNEMIAAAPQAAAGDGRGQPLRRRAGRWWRTTHRSTAASGWPSSTRLGQPAPQPFACTLLLSRRLYPHAPNHKLGSLAAFHALPAIGPRAPGAGRCRNGGGPAGAHPRRPAPALRRGRAPPCAADEAAGLRPQGPAAGHRAAPGRAPEAAGEARRCA